MLELFGRRQQELLKLLLKHRRGLSKDELASALGITRTAVGQHLAALELEGYVERGDERKTAGRPGQTYVLTDRGSDVFPKQYSWFSAVMLEALKAERGSEGLAAWLRDIATTIASGMEQRLAGLTGEARLAEIAAIMDELAFEARSAFEPEPTIEASNCIYHDLARRHPEICQFDLALLARLSGGEVLHSECMVRGGAVCRFKLEGRI